MGDIETEKLSTDDAYSIKKSKDDPPCKHFSIRGYVARMRHKDLKMCSPFTVNEFEVQPSLPPLVVPRFRSWSCNICRRENEFIVIDKSDQKDPSNGIQETPMPNSIPARIEIDLNKLTDLNGDSDDNGSNHIPINNEKKNNVEVAIDKITEYEPGLEIHLNCQVTNDRSLEVCPSPTQEMHTNEKGIEGNVAYNVELVTSNLKTKDKSSFEVPNERKHISEDNRCLEELRKSCTLSREAILVTEKHNVPEHTTEQFPPDSVAEDSVLAGDTDNNIENDVHDLHPKKHTRKPSKKRKKMRLLKEILKENDDEPKTEQITKERLAPQNPSNKPGDSQTQTTILDKIVGEGYKKKLTRTGRRGRKRKLPLDENYKPSNVSFRRAENEVQNKEPDATEIRDTIKGKEKMVQENQELDNDMLDEDSLALKKAENFSDMPVYIADPIAQAAPNEKGLEEGLCLSLNSSSQAEKQLTLPWPIQEGTSNYQLIRQGGEANSFGEQRFPSTSVISGEEKEVLIEEIDEATSKDMTAKEMELRSMNSYIDLTLDVEESDQGSFDDTTKEVVDKMAMSLPNVENEIVEATRKDTNAADMKLASMKICIDLTTDDEESNQDSLDDITIEVAEIMAKSLPDVENVNRDLKNSSQNDETVEVAERMPKSLPNVDNVNYSMMKNSSPKEKHPAIDGENGTTTRGENVFPRSGISINNFSFGGNSFGMNNLHSTQSSSGFGLSPSSGVHISPMDSNQLGHAQTSMFEVNSIGINNLQSAQSPFGFGLLPSSGVHISPMDIRHLGQAQTSMFDANSSGINNLHSAQSPFGFGLLPSTGVHISPVDTGQIGPAQTSMFKLGMREFGSSNTSLHVQGYGNATCNIAKPLPLNNAFLTPPLIVSHPPDMISLSSGSLNKQSKEREFDLNIPYSADTNQVRPSSKTSVEYPFSSQHNWTEHHPNQRVSFDLNANDTTPDINLLSLDPAGMKLVTSLNARSSDQMLKRTPNPGECLNTKLDIGKSKTYDSPEGQLSDSHKKSYLSDKSHGPTIFGRKLIGPSDLGDRNMTVSGQEKMSSSCSFMQNQKKLFGWPDLEEEEETPPQHCSARETPALLNDTSERWCEMNRNPAEFSPVEPGNPYMMDKEDKVEKTVRKKRCGSSSKQKRR